MNSVVAYLKYDRKRFVDAADYLAIVLVASLPWSTSATGILVATWLIVLVPTLDWQSLRKEIATAAGGLPVLLVALATLGMLWADVAWSERAAGLVSHLKLLVIPLLFVQFLRSKRGHWAINALLASCTALLFLSYYIYGFWNFGGYPFAIKQLGVPVKDYISQSGFFTLCAFFLIDMAVRNWLAHRRTCALLMTIMTFAFLLNIVMVATGRTALLAIVTLLVVYALRSFGWRGRVAVLLISTVLAATAWTSSPYLRYRVIMVINEINDYQVSGAGTSSGLRLAFWTNSVNIITHAPIVGHGTGSIRAMFEKAADGDVHSLVYKAANPHNQTFAVAIQLGAVGAAVLWMMWLCHILLFRNLGTASWFGLIVVVQNIVSSLVNSHLFDFTQGWTYVICIGIAGGMVRARDASMTVSSPGNPLEGRLGADLVQTVARRPKGRYERVSRP